MASLTGNTSLSPANTEKQQFVMRIMSKAARPIVANNLAGEATDEELLSAINACDDIIQEYSSRNTITDLADLSTHTTLTWKAALVFNRSLWFDSVDPETCVDVLDEADALYHKVRRRDHSGISLSTNPDIRKYIPEVEIGQALFWSWRAFNIRVQRLLKRTPDQDAGALEAKAKSTYVDYFLKWSQKSKGRVLLDVLTEKKGIEKKGISSSELDKKLAAFIDPSMPVSFPLVDDLKSISIGNPALPGTLYQVVKQFPENIVVIDFTYVPHSDQIVMICYRSDLIFYPAIPTGIRENDWIRKSDIRDWLSNVENKKRPLYNRNTAPGLMEKLSKLIEDLTSLTPTSPNHDAGPCIYEGDTVIFCPSDLLYQVPLYAISVNGVPLIERNPIVYCQNLTALLRSWETVLEYKDQYVYKAVVINPMPDNEESNSTIKRLSDDLHATRHFSPSGQNDWNIELQDVLPDIEGASVVHYHGHIHYIQPPMESFMCLDSTAFRSQIVPNQPIGQRLTANRLLDTNLAKPGLFTNISCKSGAGGLSQTGDQLGFIGALQVAGATATVSSLWRIDDADGAKWARIFYEELFKQGQRALQRAPDPNNKYAHMLDLAKANQTAVKSLRFGADGEERAPYHWAGIMLNGFWKFPNFVEHVRRI